MVFDRMTGGQKLAAIGFLLGVLTVIVVTAGLN
jgi:hypothetical protein